jgi:FixJ family two-component response regulator
VAHYEAGREQRERLSALRALLARLTPRERQVFDLVVRGQMNKQIAHALGTTERTIKAHRQKVMEKVQARSLPELVSIAERLDIAGPKGGAGVPPSVEPETRRNW